MNAQSVALEAATIRQQCKVLRMPTIAAQCAQLAEQAVRERRTHLGYLEALLQTELEEREQRLIERRLREARLPRMKTLEEFDFARNPKVAAQQIHELAKGDYIAKAEPIIFIGDSGTGKTHLLTGLAVAACRQKRRVRFASAAGLINEMVEAATGINLWREWARIEIAGGDGSYTLPQTREEYAGVILSLARQENPDTSGYNDPEVLLRIKKHHHAGLILRSADSRRVRDLLESYAQRFATEFLAVKPPQEKPTS